MPSLSVDVEGSSHPTVSSLDFRMMLSFCADHNRHTQRSRDAPFAFRPDGKTVDLQNPPFFINKRGFPSGVLKEEEDDASV